MEKTAVFGGGCFWCTEAIFQMLKGVSKVESGYAGGKMERPSYEQVSNGNTGHAEVIRVTYDPAVISYEDLLTVFFGSHDPTTPNRQGADIGEQYRSIILYQTEEEKDACRAHGQRGPRIAAKTARTSLRRSSRSDNSSRPRTTTRIISNPTRARRTARSSSNRRSRR